MKVLLIGFFTRTYMPYMEKYEDILKELDYQYDVVFFDRDSTASQVAHKGNEYTYCHKTTTSSLKKLLPVFRYISIVKRLIRKNKYDKLVVMTTMPAVLLQSILLGKYRERYIYDYRDTTYEHFGFFRKWVDKVIDGSYFTTMSSKGYLNVLSSNPKIVFNHNLSNISDRRTSADDLKEKKSITLGFVGYVRYLDVNSKLIDSFKGSKRFNLLYVGTAFSDCDLQKYASSVNADNVEVRGKYDNSDKAKIYSEIDIINSMYSLNSSEVQYAIPNRLYDAALFVKPLMTTKGTYLASIVEENGLGFSIDPFTDDIQEKAMEYINAFDSVKFQRACEVFLRAVFEDEHVLDKKIRDFFQS